MSLYKCERCDWEWRDSSFFAGVQADGCPKCGSNIIKRIGKASKVCSGGGAMSNQNHTCSDCNADLSNLSLHEHVLLHRSLGI